MKIEAGEIITLSNDKEYICFSTAESDGKDYVYLMSNFKPLEIKFAEQFMEGEKVNVRIINEQEEKQKVLALFQKNN
ncbi:MAG: hypothetical protein E7173_01400 [Firmicutes bacterium]|nr:hypothetical protein [Bacillota bacterium]